VTRTARPLSEVPFDDAVAIVQAKDAALLGHVRAERRDVAEWSSRSDLEHDGWAFEEGGRLVAFGFFERRGEVASGAGFVHPAETGRGLGTALVDRAEEHARELGHRVLRQWTYGADPAAHALFEARRYGETRRFWEMAIDLDGPPPAAELPAGLRIEPFRVEDARGFHATSEESFSEHWGHIGRSFEQWWERRSNAEGFDPTLWFLVRDGDEIAAICECESGRRTGGHIGVLGVRKPWRRRGLGLALLLHAFGELYRRGERHVTLGVDSANETGATKLYERAGMYVEVEEVVFEKALT
jgi:mycothiol synthase